MLIFLTIVIAIAAMVISARISNVSNELSKVSYSLNDLRLLLASEFNKESEYYKLEEKSDRDYRQWEEETKGWAPADTMPVPPRPPTIVAINRSLKGIEDCLRGLIRKPE